jgi:hypothetical protein
VVHHVRDRVLPPSAWRSHPLALQRLLALGAVADALLRNVDPAALVDAGADEDADDDFVRELLAAVQPVWALLPHS